MLYLPMILVNRYINKEQPPSKSDLTHFLLLGGKNNELIEILIELLLNGVIRFLVLYTLELYK
jgi:hypothetical protein